MDGHISLVVTAKDTGMSKIEIGDITLERVELGHRLQFAHDFESVLAGSGNYFINIALADITLVVDADSGVARHGGIVAAAIDVRDVTCFDFQIGLA